MDPVALDQAVSDKVNAQPENVGGPVPDLQAKAQAEGVEAPTHFHAVNPHANWEICLQHAEELGVGTRAYTLVEVD